MPGPYRYREQLSGLMASIDTYTVGADSISARGSVRRRKLPERMNPALIKIVIKNFEIYPPSTAASALAAYSPARRASSSVFAWPPISIKRLPVVKS